MPMSTGTMCHAHDVHHQTSTTTTIMVAFTEVAELDREELPAMTLNSATLMDMGTFAAYLDDAQMKMVQQMSLPQHAEFAK